MLKPDEYKPLVALASMIGGECRAAVVVIVREDGTYSFQMAGPLFDMSYMSAIIQTVMMDQIGKTNVLNTRLE